MVIETTDSYLVDSVSFFSTNRNQVTIEHKDGTSATYIGFGYKNISVKIGEVVTKETFLGSLTEPNTDYHHALSLSIYYLSDPQFSDKTVIPISEQTNPNTYVNPKFMSSNGLASLTNNMKYNVDERMNEPMQKSKR